MNKIMSVGLVVLLAGCGGATQLAAPTTPTDTATSTSSSVPDTPTSTAPPQAGDTLTITDGSGDEADYTVSAPIKVIPISDQDYDREAAVTITVVGDEGSFVVSNGDLLTPATAGEDRGDFGGGYDSVVDASEPDLATGPELAAAKTLCAGRKTFADIENADTSSTNIGGSSYTLDAGKTISFCLPFRYSSKTPPTKLVYSDSTTGTGAVPIYWTVHLPAASGTAAKPTVLATFSGDGSKLLTLPASVQNEPVKVTWHMPSSGNNVIEGESDSAGDNLDLLTNVVGANDGSTSDKDLSEDTYFQVLSEGSWTITITNF